MIHSANLHNPDASGEWRKQLLYIGIGVAVMAFCASTDYRRWQRWAMYLYLANLALLCLVWKSGHSAMGAQRWISVGPLGTFQPSEPAKVTTAIADGVATGGVDPLRLGYADPRSALPDVPALAVGDEGRRCDRSIFRRPPIRRSRSR